MEDDVMVLVLLLLRLHGVCYVLNWSESLARFMAFVLVVGLFGECKHRAHSCVFSKVMHCFSTVVCCYFICHCYCCCWHLWLCCIAAAAAVADITTTITLYRTVVFSLNFVTNHQSDRITLDSIICTGSGSRFKCVCICIIVDFNTFLWRFYYVH